MKEKKLSGYRIIDMKILSNVFSMLLCPICQCETLVLHEDSSKKHGLCSSLYLKCMKWEYKNDFLTSEKFGRSFEINQRIVYFMRSLGQRYTSIEKFNALMNIPPPMTKNSYETVTNKIASFTKDVTEETMGDATIEIHYNTSSTNNSATVVDTSVLCD